MKKTIAVLIILTMLLALTGCAPAGGKTEAPAPKAASAAMPAPVPAEPVKAEKESVALSPWFPAERITLPPGSKVIGVSNNFADANDITACREKTVLELGLTKTEAIEYFTPMLKAGNVDQFEDSGDTSEHIPWEISGDYPEVTNFVELYAGYPYASDSVAVSIIKVTLFTKEDKETVAVAWIEVKYNVNPTAAPTPAAEKQSNEPEPQQTETNASNAEPKLAALKQYALDAGMEVIPDDWRYGWFIKDTTPLGGFDLGIEDYYMSILEFADAGQVSEFMDEQAQFEYDFFAEGRFLAVYTKDTLTNQAAALDFVGKMFKAAQ